MENNLIENTEISNIFKLDYINQNVNNNIHFQSWKQSMLEKYGTDAKLFRCTKNGLLFFTSNLECKKYPFYKSKCPLCHKYICYFCSKYETNNYYHDDECCLYIRIIYMFLKDGFKYINPVGEDKNYFDPKEDISTLKLNFIPLLNITMIIGEINYSFYYKLYKKTLKLTQKLIVI